VTCDKEVGIHKFKARHNQHAKRIFLPYKWRGLPYIQYIYTNTPIHPHKKGLQNKEKEKKSADRGDSM